jgi:hypothetical protein
VDEAVLVFERRNPQHLLDGGHATELTSYGRRELSTCSISRLTCWRSMNSR